MLELKDKVKISNKVAGVLQNRQDRHVEDNTTCLVTGWGETLTGESRQNLRGIEVPTFNQEKCEKAYEGVRTITSRMLCAGFKEGGKDACDGNYNNYRY